MLQPFYHLPVNSTMEIRHWYPKHESFAMYHRSRTLALFQPCIPRILGQEEDAQFNSGNGILSSKALNVAKL